MNEKLKKIKQIIKKVSKWIIKNLKWIIAVLGGFMIVMCVKNVIAKIGKVDKDSAWSAVPGDKTKVFVYKKDGGRITVTLPKNPRTGKQVKSDEIKTIGLPKNPESQEDLNVEILHTPVNRR